MSINRDRFIFYADYYALAARSGVQSAQSLFNALSYIRKTDVSTIEIKTSAIAALNGLDVSFSAAYETIFTNAYSTTPMKDAFTKLSEHVKKIASQSLDDYITQNNIQVPPTYASLSNVYGDPISSVNIDNSDTCMFS